jgi:tetratricopeptide (TPR) repeat protein
MRADHGGPGTRRATIRRGAAAYTLAASLALPAAARAQGTDGAALKPLPAATGPAERVACPSVAPVATPSPTRRERARQRLALAQEAAIVGNRPAAREQLQRAAELDPSNAEIAYQLARTLDESGSSAEAVREYCRYLSLGPRSSDAADAAEVRERVAALTAARRTGPTDLAGAAFAAGARRYEESRLPEADAQFSAALARAPRWADAYYNRAVVRRARGEELAAARDFRQYLELEPAAPDRGAVLARIDSLVPEPPFTASTALNRGLMLPGLGQIYTERPAFAAATMVAVGAALAVAFHTEEHVDHGVVVVDGIPVPQTETSVSRPYLVPGLIAAVAFTGAAAYEAYSYAERAWRTRRSVVPSPATGPPAVRPLIAPSSHGLDVGVQIPLGRKSRGVGGRE